ncbi:MAG: EutN/CcmL family microcompartment protein [Thermoguttaceae bacterium]|jgi:microcompartment protein CcmK/EutM|nr:EutN/CcmL family microcompartment protein [Thermoguttaceae bacterium]
MRIGQVIGKVVLSRVHESLIGAQFKVVLPLTFSDLAEPNPTEAARETCEQEREQEDAERVDVAVNRLVNPSFPRQWGNELVVYDDCSAALGEWIAFSEGAEAAAAFGQDKRPVDAFGGAILDTVVIDAPTVDALVELKKAAQ